MATKREVEFWKDQCRKLTAALDRSREDKHALTARIWDNSEEAKTARAIADGLEWQVEELGAENARLRELATYALRHIIEVECEGKSCEWCTEDGSSDCPKCMPGMFGFSNWEVSCNAYSG